jgi:hypothetical protein
VDKQATALDDLVKVFQEELSAMIAVAQRAVFESLTSRLSIVGGVISSTKSNQKILRNIAPLFQREMGKAGYPALVDEFVRAFNGQFVYFDEVLNKLGESIGQKLPLSFGQKAQNLLASQQLSTTVLLEDVVVAIAADVQRQALLSVGGLKLADLISEIADQLQKGIWEATTLADTAVSTHWRVMLDQGYQMVEKELPATIEATYKYGGPDDRVTRQFCHVLVQLSQTGKTWTRDEIDAMENGQIPGVLTSCGGFNCRHQWLMVVSVL